MLIKYACAFETANCEKTLTHYFHDSETTTNSAESKQQDKQSTHTKTFDCFKDRNKR